MKQRDRIIIGSDHAGFPLKEYIKSLLIKHQYCIEDIGTYSQTSVDYPDYAEKVALKVRKKPRTKGILVCGTGIGASIAANKIPGIRAALVNDVKDARLSKEHNDANILVLGGRPFKKLKVKKIVHVWLRSKYKGQRHARRVRKIHTLEKKYSRVM